MPLDPVRYPHIRYLVGIDEAGRGPIAGPVAVGVAVLPVAYHHEGKFRDSKKLPQHKREKQYEAMQLLREAGELRFAVAQSGAGVIDRTGIVPAVASAMERALATLSLEPSDCMVLLDGGLRAPQHFMHQETIIKGDEKEYVIALASIAAKVTRDAYMRRASWRYPEYGFEQHKGYGTREHYRCLKTHGMCEMHRKSFLKGLGE